MQRHEHFRNDMENAAKALQTELLKLIPVERRLDTVEKQLQEQIVVDVFRGEKTHANMLANELVVIRKVSRLVSDLKVIFETLIVRIGTIRDYSEFNNALNSTVTGLNEVKHDLTKVIPSARAVFADISQTVPSTLLALDIKNQPNASTVTDDALEILEEASNLVEERLKHKFPTLPEIEQEKRVAVNV